MKLIGIFGTGRNGSTLLCRLLDGIPGAYMHPVDVVFLDSFNDLATINWVRRRVHNNTTRHKLQRLDKVLSTHRLLRYFKMQHYEMRKDYLLNTKETIVEGPDAKVVISKKNSYRINEFVPAFLDALAHWACPELSAKGGMLEAAIFKSIETPYIADYEIQFPDMQFVHILRDPVKTWASFKRTLMVSGKRPSGYLGDDNLISFLEYRWIPHIEFLVKRADDPKHIVVRYEDLVNDPVKSIASVVKHCELPMPAEPDTQTILNGRHFRVMPGNPSKKGIAAPEKVVKEMSRKYSYDEVVTDRERQLIRLRTRELGKRFGYFIEEPLPDPEALQRDWCQSDEWDVLNLDGWKGWVKGTANRRIKRNYVRRLCRGGMTE